MAAKLIGERLPPNWSYAVTRDGRIFFIDDNSQMTTWLHPLTGQPVQTGHSNATDDADDTFSEDLPFEIEPGKYAYFAQDLPPGWEQALTIEGAVYYIDHNSRMTTFENPMRGQQSFMDNSLNSPTKNPGIKQGPSRRSQKSKSIKAPSASRGENSKVILKGWLQKQESSGLRLWKKKWCVLADFGLFFYKDDSEANCIGSILLPSYNINPCNPAQVNKKFAFKAEHDNMKTFYFAAESQPEMDRWVEALRMASLVQKAPQSGLKLIPKSPIMSWTDNMDSPGVSPPDMHQYPFSSPEGGQHRPPSESRYRERSPLQSRENTNNYGPNVSADFSNRSYSHDPRDDSGSMRGSQRSSQRGSYDPRDTPRQGQGYGPNDPNRSYDPRYPSDRIDQQRTGSLRSNPENRGLPSDPRSRSSAGQMQGQYPSNTLPRDSRMHPSMQQQRSQTLPHRGQGQGQGQDFNSLPRDSRSRLHPDEMDQPYSHSSPRQTLERQSSRGRDSNDRSPRKKEDNPYMMMMSPQNQQFGERRMDPSKHSKRPLPQEPLPDPRHERERSGGGDYASLTRYKDKWQNQNLSDSNPSHAHSPPSQYGSNAHSPPIQQGNHAPMNQMQPDLYVDIPHTYVNVYDESQVRDQAPDLPMRPPLPAEMRGQIIHDIAQSHSPNTQKEMLQAEKHLELRMRQPPVFNYPTPTRESLPQFPQESPRSQQSHRSQASNDPRSRYSDKGRQPQLPPRRPDLAPLSNADDEIAQQNARNSYTSQPSSGSYHISHGLDGSDNTLTNEDRNEKISEFYGLGKYNEKNGGRYGDHNDKNRIMSDLDVHSRTLPSKPKTGLTGEKDFRLRSLPDHVQSMPAIYHEQEPLSIIVPEQQPVVNSSYVNLLGAPPSQEREQPMMNGYNDQTERKSAFRPLSGSSNSLPRYNSDSLQRHSYNPPGYSDQEQTDVKRLSSASSQMSQPRLPRKQDGFPGQFPPDNNPMRGQGQGGKGQGQGGRGQRLAPPGIHTVREEPDMPDSQVIETDLPKRVFPLSGPRLRMSISATDLLGKTHDELVLLLIQLRRDKAELNGQRDGVRKLIEQNRPMEIYYRKLQSDGRPIDREKENQHQRYLEMKHDLEEVEKKLEVYKPLVNLVCNMVTMGSLYGGDNLMLATEYRKHLLSPEQYSPPKKMLEFSRKHQEDQVVQEIEEDVRQLTKEQADLEEKLDRLYELDRVLQEQSFQVTSLKEDREMLEKALGSLLKKQDQNCTNPRELDKLISQQRTIEKELSRVLQQLAEASKELEETTAENNKIEHEVALLRSKVYGNVSRSKSAPSLTSESLHTKMKMEKDLAKVRNMMEGLSEQGAKLGELMTSLRQGKAPDKPASPTRKGPESKDKSRPTETYYETDLDTSQSKDLAQVTALLASYQLGPAQPNGGGDFSPEPIRNRTIVPTFTSAQQSQPTASAFRTVSPGQKESDPPLFHASPVYTREGNYQPVENLEQEGDNQWDIGGADDNTKRFFDFEGQEYNVSTGLIPKNMPKSQTVRDVKRHSEYRKDSKKKEDDPPPLRVGVIPSSTDYTDSTFHVYENLPQQKSAPSTESTIKPAWASVALEADNPSSSERRRSALHLITPKPFTPYGSKPSIYSSVSSGIGDSQPDPIISQTQPYSSSQPDPIISQSQPYSSGSNLDFGQSNDSYTPAEPIKSISTSKTPPPPPVRGTSKLVTADVTKYPSLPHLAMMTGQTATSRNYPPPIPTILKKGRNNRDKARYMTISSSQPVKLETNVPTSPKQHSVAGDLISSMDVPDIVKSSTTKIDQFDERTIDREILFFPEKVEIPERYVPDSDDDEETLTAEEKARRKQKAAKIKKILTQQSVHSLSQPDVSKVAGEVHERVQQEKQLRAQLLGINQELAEQVKRKSRQFAAERRKTWSGTPHKSESSEDHDRSREAEDDPSDANNNSYSVDRFNDSMSSNPYTKDSSPYREDSYSRADNSNSSPYREDSYSREENSTSSLPFSYHRPTTSYADRPNFKI